MSEENIVKLNIDLLEPSQYQPRKQFNENSLKELALSIKEYGILNPILVRKKDDKYEIVAGERRFRAAKLLGLTEVPAIVKEINDEKVSEIALIENLQRENITPIEEAMTYKEILTKSNKTEKELSEMIGKSQPFIANKLRLLNLPKNIQDALINRKISERHARSLLTIKDESKQTELLEKVIQKKLSVRELDNIIESLNESDELIKKEEKESDKMNNGNFFPNFNTQQDMNNNQTSLNSMNMQTMENNIGQTQGIVTPQIQATPEALMQPTPNNEITNGTTFTSMSEPINSEVTSSIQNFGTATSSFDVPVMTPQINPSIQTNINPEPMSEPTQMGGPISDIPLFNSPEFNQPIPENPIQEIPQPVAEVQPTTNMESAINEMSSSVQSEQPMIDPPLFNNELLQQNAEANQLVTANTPVQTAYEVPVTTENNIPTEDKFTQVKELLNNNGIEYKAYSNETGHCIIIEL